MIKGFKIKKSYVGVEDFLFSKNIKRFLLLIIIFSNFQFRSLFSNQRYKVSPDYIHNLKECSKGINKVNPDNPKKYADELILKCNKALVEEKSQLRKSLIFLSMAELKILYETKNEDEKIKIAKERIKLYKKSLKILENISSKDIQEYNTNRPLESQPDYEEAKTYFWLIKQNNYSKIGKIYQILKQYDIAIKNFQKSNEFFKEGVQDSEILRERTLGFLAYSFVKLGQTNNARKILETIIDEEYRCSEIKENCIADKILLSRIYYEMGRITQSIEVLNSITKEDNIRLGNINAGGDDYLCTALFATENNKLNYHRLHDQAIKDLIEFNQANNEIIKNCNLNSFQDLLIMANFHANQGEYQLAILELKDALKIIKNNFDKENYDSASIKLEIGVNYQRLGEIDLAKKYYKEAFEFFDLPNVSINRSINNSKFAYASLLIAKLPSDSKKIYEGINYFKKAMDYELIHRQKIIPFLSIDERLKNTLDNNDFQTIYNSTFQLSNFLKKRNLDNLKASRLSLYSRINFQGLNEDIERKQNLISKAENSHKNDFEEIRILESKLSARNLGDDQFKKLRNKLKKLETKFYKKLPQLQPKLFSVKYLADLLPKKSVLLEFQKYQPANNELKNDSNYQVLLLFPNNDVITVELGNAKEINEKIKLLNKSIIVGEKAAIEESIFDLYSIIFEPLNPFLNDSKILFISPDSDINLVPLNTIKIGETENYLSDIYELNIVANARELVRILSEKDFKPNKQSIVFSNPDFNLKVKNKNLIKEDQSEYLRIGSDCKNWNYLDGTIEEGYQIKRLINAKLFTEKEATVGNLKNLNLPPKILHLATHGYFCEDDIFSRHPLVKSGVVLAGANMKDQKEGDDGYLSSLEVSKLNLKNTELVVLSACNTALGDIETGNGVLGLRRSLSLAGARSTLLSLWEVDDFATRAFMTSFYQKLKSGNNLREALIVTQREFRNGVINSGDPDIDWSEEFYWGAFQLSGDSSANLFN